MTLATKQRIIAQPWHATRRYILSTMPVLWISGRKDSGGTNQFISDDAYGHLCTVTGATWGQQGRTFNGTTDLITVTDSSSIQNIFDNGGTVLVWANATTAGENSGGRFLDKTASGTTGWEFQFTTTSKLVWLQYFNGATDGTWQTDENHTIGIPHLYAVTYSNALTTNDPIFYIDGVSQAFTEIATPQGTRDSDVGSNLIVGNRTLADRTFNGVIGEVIVSKRIMTPAEVKNFYLKTKWRY